MSGSNEYLFIARGFEGGKAVAIFDPTSNNSINKNYYNFCFFTLL